MSKLIDIYIDQNADFLATMPPITDNCGNVVDLTYYTVTSQMRRSYTTQFAIQLNVTYPILNDSGLPDPTQGIIILSLPAIETSGLVNTRYVYDIVITDNYQSRPTMRVFEGLAYVNAGVTTNLDTIMISPYVPEDYGGL
jgi:hypothetical protein